MIMIMNMDILHLRTMPTWTRIRLKDDAYSAEYAASGVDAKSGALPHRQVQRELQGLHRHGQRVVSV